MGSRLVQLDGLTQRNRTLTQLFHGVMQARLLGAARESGRRMDDVSAKLEPIVRSLRVRGHASRSRCRWTGVPNKVARPAACQVAVCWGGGSIQILVV